MHCFALDKLKEQVWDCSLHSSVSSLNMLLNIWCFVAQTQWPECNQPQMCFVARSFFWSSCCGTSFNYILSKSRGAFTRDRVGDRFLIKSCFSFSFSFLPFFCCIDGNFVFGLVHTFFYFISGFKDVMFSYASQVWCLSFNTLRIILEKGKKHAFLMNKSDQIQTIYTIWQWMRSEDKCRALQGDL